MRIISGLLAALFLSACSVQNTSHHTLQFNAETLAFPETYQSEAARVAAARSLPGVGAMVSRPLPLIGRSAFSPRIWYSCVIGLSGAPAGSEGRTFHTVLFFAEAGRPAVRTALDSVLCTDVTYEPITARPPIT